MNDNNHIDYNSGLNQIQTMFPQLDRELIELILEQNENRIEASIDMLLNMTKEWNLAGDDFNYKDSPKIVQKNNNEEPQISIMKNSEQKYIEKGIKSNGTKVDTNNYQSKNNQQNNQNKNVSSNINNKTQDKPIPSKISKTDSKEIKTSVKNEDININKKNSFGDKVKSKFNFLNKILFILI